MQATLAYLLAIARNAQGIFTTYLKIPYVLSLLAFQVFSGVKSIHKIGNEANG